MTLEMRVSSNSWMTFILAWTLATLLSASYVGATMVGMVVGRNGNVVVEKDGNTFPVDGFICVDVGDRVMTKGEGGQLLLFDNSRAQLLPSAKYRVGRSGVFKKIARGCVLAHQYKRQFPAGGPISPNTQSPTVGTLRLGKGAFILRPGHQWKEVTGDEQVHINDIIHVQDGGGARLETTSGGIVHFTGPAQGYLNGRGLELEVGKILVNSASVAGGLTIGTPTAEAADTKSLFGMAVQSGVTKVRNYGGNVNLANRFGRRKNSLRMTGLCQGAVDEGGQVTKSERLVGGEDGRNIVATVLRAINDGSPKGYHERIAYATAALGKAIAEGKTQKELAKFNPEDNVKEGYGQEDGYEQEEDDWKSEVSNYFNNFQDSQNQPSGQQSQSFPEPSEIEPTTYNRPPASDVDSTSNVRPVPSVTPATTNVRPTTYVRPTTPTTVRPTTGNVRARVRNLGTTNVNSQSTSTDASQKAARNRMSIVDFQFR